MQPFTVILFASDGVNYYKHKSVIFIFVEVMKPIKLIKVSTTSLLVYGITDERKLIYVILKYH